MPDISYTITGQVSKGALSQSFAASGVTANIATAGVLSVTLNLGDMALDSLRRRPATTVIDV